MAVVKKKTRRKLAKQLTKLVKKHGAEIALALVAGIVSSLAADKAPKGPVKAKTLKPVKTLKTLMKPVVKAVVASKRQVV